MLKLASIELLRAVLDRRIASIACIERIVQNFESPSIRSRSSLTQKLIVLELRQLRGAEHHLVAHQQRRCDFGVAVLSPVCTSSMNCPSARSSRASPFFSTTKRAPDNFAASLEIHLAERFAELEMLLRRERVVALRAEAMMLDIVVRVLAVRHIVERQVGNLRQRLVELLGRASSPPPPAPGSRS